MTELPFVKMHGTGNDFVVLDGFSTDFDVNTDWSRLAQVLCARRFGVGGDGLLLLTRANDGICDLQMRMWNPDGSEDMCGNGLRCVAHLAQARGIVSSSEFSVQTRAGVRQCAVMENGMIRVEMGAPLFDFASIPIEPLLGRSDAIEYSLDIGEQRIEHVTSLSTGSTHTVIFCDELPSDEEFLRLSPLIENHENFPERTTILWTKVLSRERAQVRIWERGVGETLACGTGACAVAVAALSTQRAASPLVVQSKGGDLTIRWQPDESTTKTTTGSIIEMTGPAKIVYEGIFNLGLTF